MVGQVAIQQAMVCELKLSYRKAAALMRVNHRTIWQHVAARRGSNVAAWENRSEAQRAAATAEALRIIGNDHK